VVSADLAQSCVSVNLRFGETDCHISWVDLPGIARYKQEFAFYAPDHRLILQLPSPFLRSMPSRLFVEGGERGSTRSWKREETISYEEAFKRELLEFADCIASGREPRTSGRLCEAVARAHQGLDPELAVGEATPRGAGAR
jgi:predicted dehydrogenase